MQNSKHQSEIASLAMTPEGSIIASASIQGTLLRIFDRRSGTLLHELRRGMDKALIKSLVFHPLGHWIACISDKETLHIFGIGPNSSKNKTSTIRAISRFLPSYFSSVWSFSHYKLSDTSSYCVFNESSLIVAKTSLIELDFDINIGGECRLVSELNIE